MTCCFFGHRMTPPEVEPRLEATVEALIQEGADNFYVGNQGNFDRMARRVLTRLQARHTFRFAVVLAYMPGKREEFPPLHPYETLLPDGLESVPPRYAICKRNDWMVAQADAVIAYVTDYTGGAGRSVRMAQRRRLRVINLAP